MEGKSTRVGNELAFRLALIVIGIVFVVQVVGHSQIGDELVDELAAFRPKPATGDDLRCRVEILGSVAESRESGAPLSAWADWCLTSTSLTSFQRRQNENLLETARDMQGDLLVKQLQDAKMRQEEERLPPSAPN